MEQNHLQAIIDATAMAIGQAIVSPRRQQHLAAVARVLRELQQDVHAIVIDDGKA